jgi:hypothetical protein
MTQEENPRNDLTEDGLLTVATLVRHLDGVAVQLMKHQHKRKTETAQISKAVEHAIVRTIEAKGWLMYELNERPSSALHAELHDAVKGQ